MNYFYFSAIPDAGTKLGIPGFDADTKSNNPGISEFNVSGFLGWGNSGTNWFQKDHTWQAAEQLSGIHANHNLVAGAEFRKLYTSRRSPTAREVSLPSMARSLVTPRRFHARLRPESDHANHSIPGRCGAWRDGFFVPDNWQVSRSSPSITATATNCRPAVFSCRVRPGTGQRPNGSGARNSAVAGLPLPRPEPLQLGAAGRNRYRIDDKTVVRIGGGIYYNPNQTNSFTFLTTNPPFGNSTTCIATPARQGCRFQPAQRRLQYFCFTDWITDNWHLPLPQ